MEVCFRYERTWQFMIGGSIHGSSEFMSGRSVHGSSCQVGAFMAVHVR
jgi:hypothetical protein